MTTKETKKCIACADGMMTYKKQWDTVSYAGHSKKVRVPAWWCDSCEESIFDAESQRVHFVALAELKAKVNKKIGPAEIRRIREKLGISQRMASELINGSGPNSFYKYESGKVAASGAVCAALRLLDAHPESLKTLIDA